MLEEKIKSIVIRELKIDESVYNEELAAGDIPEWDSFAHMNLLMAVESELDITFEVTDSIDIETVGDLIDTCKKYVS